MGDVELREVPTEKRTAHGERGGVMTHESTGVRRLLPLEILGPQFILGIEPVTLVETMDASASDKLLEGTLGHLFARYLNFYRWQYRSCRIAPTRCGLGRSR
jgi:hypothetical protein